MIKGLVALQLKCMRCGYSWIKRKMEDPQQCPKCHSPYWKNKRVRASDRKAWQKDKEG